MKEESIRAVGCVLILWRGRLKASCWRWCEREVILGLRQSGIKEKGADFRVLFLKRQRRDFFQC